MRLVYPARDILSPPHSKPHNISYLVLSHCWGKKELWGERQPTTLTPKNEPEFKVGLNTSQLPQNFIDAILATHELGFQYVWIDSLCIMQGEDGDWESESLLMDKVYMNADMCLAASAASHAFGGFLDKKRNLADFQPISIDAVGASSPPTGLFAYPHNTTTASRLWEQLAEESPLNHRGWVLQERVLSPRTVHFTSEQLCWECEELQALELIPNVELSGRSSKDSELGQDKGPAVTAQDYDTYQKWRRIVQKYTECDPLTKDNDKLVAISGLANFFSQRLGNYYAGLWEDMLPFDLLWDLGSTGQIRRPEAYRAPTWSWASLDGKITWDSLLGYPNNGCDRLIDFNSVDIYSKTGCKYTTGQVEEGTELELFGHLVPKDRKRLIEGFRFEHRRDEPHLFDMERDPFFLLPLLQRWGGWPLLDRRNKEDGCFRLRGLILGRDRQQNLGPDGVVRYRRLGIFEMDNLDLACKGPDPKLQEQREWLGSKTIVRII